MARPDLFPPDRGLQARMVLALVVSLVLLAAAVAGLVLLAMSDVSELLFFIGCFLVIGAVEGKLYSGRRARRARPPEPRDATRVTAAAQRLAVVGELRVPRVEIAAHTAPLSWVTAKPWDEPSLFVTTGLLDRLDEEHLDAVVAHELGHLANRDAVVMTVVAGPPAAFWAGVRMMWAEGELRAKGAVIMYAGWLLPAVFAMTVAGRVVSRHRELAADRVAAVLTGSPAGVAAALLSVSEGIAGIPRKDLRRVAPRDPFHFLPARAREVTGVRRLWATHPRLERRLAQLDEMEAALQRAR